MRKQTPFYLFFVILVLLPAWSIGSIRFGANNSGITLLNNATLDVVNSFTNEEGIIRQRENSSILGDTIYYNLGSFEKNMAPVIITGHFHPDVSGTGTIELHGTQADPHIFRADPGTQIDYLRVEGSHNRLEGFPLFNNPIVLADADTTVTVAIQSILNQNIELNGGRIILDENLILADGVSLTGPGTILLNDRRLEFGTKDLEITSSLYWIGAADVYMSGKITLKATWTFENECYFNGDSTILRLEDSGALAIRDNSSLYIRELKISGLGNEPGLGKIYFEDPGQEGPDVESTSKLYLRRAALELTTTYTISGGHVVTEVGSNQIITRNNILYFDKPAKLTVDGINLFYKTRTFPDSQNIQPTVYNDVTSPIEILRQGDIIHYKSFQSRQTFVSTYQGGLLNQNVYLGTGVDVQIVSGQPIIDGQGWYYHFARNKTNLLKVDPSVAAELTNLVLKDFNPQHVELASGASLTFKNNVTIELGNDIAFGTKEWTFQGDCKIDGKGKVVSLQDGKIKLEDLSGGPSTLLLQDMTLEGLTDEAIEIDSCQSKIIFKDVKLKLAEDFSFSKGFFEVEGRMDVFSEYDDNQVQFIYDTDCTTSSRIGTGSTLHFDRNVTFSYAPASQHNGLIDFGDKSSVLSLNGAALAATTTGLQLIKGTLLVDYICTISCDARNLHEAIIFGDGTSAGNDLNIDVMPGGKINLVRGYVDYKNIEL